MQRKHAILIAGTHSGCGKTTISLGIMAALRARGYLVQPFKVGPDFIDPGFHTQVTGLQSRNLDGWMLSPGYNRALYQRLLARADVAVIEGVMGLYDGYNGVSESGSSAEMAKWLGIPAILIVDARSMARSAAALVYGFTRFDRELRVAGVIFNRIGGEGHLQYLREAMKASLPEVPVLGGIPREDSITIPERHLGLVTAEEMRLDPRWQQNLIDTIERYVNLDLILKRTECEGPGPLAGVESARKEPPVIIAVARDAAFCFYYPDNLEMLQEAGARLCFFSPLAGEVPPEGTAGLYLGGGYPEVHAKALAGNTKLFHAIRKYASLGMPIYAECGGLMTLSRFIETTDGKRYPMAGIFPFGTRMLTRRKALGYMEVVLQSSCLLGEPGLTIRGHEFHYSKIVETRQEPHLEFAYVLRKREMEAIRPEGYKMGSVLASYVHLHWGSAPGVPGAFVKQCRKKTGESVNR